MCEVIIKPQILIPELGEQYPSTQEVFNKYGTKGYGGPEILRKTSAFFHDPRIELIRLTEVPDVSKKKHIAQLPVSDFKAPYPS